MIEVTEGTGPEGQSFNVLTLTPAPTVPPTLLDEWKASSLYDADTGTLNISPMSEPAPLLHRHQAMKGSLPAYFFTLSAAELQWVGCPCQHAPC